MLTNYFTHQGSNQLTCTKNISPRKRFLCHLEASILEEFSLKHSQIFIEAWVRLDDRQIYYWCRWFQRLHNFNKLCRERFEILGQVIDKYIDLINTKSSKVLKKFFVALFAFWGDLHLLDGLKCLIGEQRTSDGGLFVHQEDLHGIVSVHITLKECFEDA